MRFMACFLHNSKGRWEKCLHIGGFGYRSQSLVVIIEKTAAGATVFTPKELHNKAQGRPAKPCGAIPPRGTWRGAPWVADKTWWSTLKGLHKKADAARLDVLVEPLQGTSARVAVNPGCARPVVRGMTSPRGLAGRPWALGFNSFGVKIVGTIGHRPGLYGWLRHLWGTFPTCPAAGTLKTCPTGFVERTIPGGRLHAARLFEDVIRFLRHTCAIGVDCELTDAQLLDRFLNQREESAFTFLVQRHGPMILGVGRRVLGDAHEAEDVLQATFLILARRNRAIGGKRSIGGWLHGVAHHVALKAKAKSIAQRNREREVRTMPSARPVDELTCQELRAALYDAIASLPEKYHAPVVLCYLEGKSYDQAAQELGCPKTTLARRLTQAREILRKKLAHRGIGLTAAALATALADVATASPLPAILTIKTVKAAGLVLAGKSVVGCLTAGAIALAEEAMVVAKAKLVLMVVVMGLAVGGVGWAEFGGLRHSEKPSLETRGKPLAAVINASSPVERVLPVATDEYGDPLPPGALRRFGTVRFRDLAQPTSQLTFAARGMVLISAGAQFYGICAWDAQSGRPLYRLRAPRTVMTVAVSPDGKSLFTNDDVGIFWGIDVATGTRLRKFLPGAWGQAAFSPDGRTVAVAEYERWQVIRWDFNTGKMLPRLGEKDEIGSAVAFAPNGKTLATASPDNSIRLWNGATGKEIRRFIGHEKLVYSVAFAPDGKVLASAGEGDLIRLWDVDKDEPVRLLTGSDGYNSKVLFSPDGKFLATTGQSGQRLRNSISSETLRLWDLTTGKEIHRWEMITGMAFSPDGKILATVRRDGVIRRWNPATGVEIDPPTGHTGLVLSLQFTRDGKTLLSRALNGTAMAWNLRSGAHQSLFEGPAKTNGTAQWRTADVSPDGKTVALNNWANAGLDAIRLWDAYARKETRTLSVDKGASRWRANASSRRMARS